MQINELKFTKLNEITKDLKYKWINVRGSVLSITLNEYESVKKPSIKLYQFNTKIILQIWNKLIEEYQSIKKKRNQ